nr:hypothetical protein [Comamonas jiangduensis]
MRISEGLPIAALMALCMVLTVKADSVMQYTRTRPIPCMPQAPTFKP